MNNEGYENSVEYHLGILQPEPYYQEDERFNVELCSK